MDQTHEEVSGKLSHKKPLTRMKPTTCMQCHREFKKASLLEDHIRRIHFEEKSFVCSHCPKAFFKKSDLATHMFTHNDQYNFQCKTCLRMFKHVSNLNRHIRTHTGEKPYLCSICQKRYSQVAALQQHLSTEQHKSKSREYSNGQSTCSPPGNHENPNKRGWFYCGSCDNRFQFVRQLREHEREHTNAEIGIRNEQDTADFPEEVSNKCSSSVPAALPQKSLQIGSVNPKMLNIQSETEPINSNSVQLTLTPSGQILLDNNEVLLTLKDKMYGIVLVNNDVTIVENNTATRVLKNLCPTERIGEDCPFISANDTTFPEIPMTEDTDHLDVLNEDAPESDQLHEIKEKDKLYVLELMLVNEKIGEPKAAIEQERIEKEKAKPSYTCAECDRVFNRKSNYQQHLGTHFTSQMKHECPVCGRHFAWKSSVMKHISSEHGERTSYSCDQCDRVYSSSQSVQKHIQRDHLKIKSHQCSECDKAFFRKYDLQLHFRIHTEERPYVCAVCSKAFRHPSHLIRHSRLHEKDEIDSTI